MHGEYCHVCGQKRIEKRFKLKSVLTDLFHSITNIENGFTKTTIDGIIRPGELFHNFITGATRNYMKPFRFAFIWATVSTLILIYSGVFDLQQESVMETFGQPEQDALQMQMTNKINEFIRKFMSLTVLMIIPFNALGSWVVFMGSKYQRDEEMVKYNFAEHLILNTYIVGVATALGTVFTLFFACFPKLALFSSFTGLIFSQIMSIYIFQRVFKKGWVISIGASMLASTISFTLLMILSLVIGILFAVVYFGLMGAELPQ